MRRVLLRSGLIALGVFVAVNLALWGIYNNRTYPRTRVMQATIGSVPYSGLSAKVSTLQLLPEKITLSHEQQTAELTLAEIGISKDIRRTTDSAKRQRSWLPILNLFKSPELQAPVAVNTSTLTARGEALSKTLRQDAVNAKLTLNGATVDIAASKPGYELNRPALQRTILQGLDKAKTTIAAPTTITQPKITPASLKNQKKDLEAQLKTPITYTFNGKSKQAAATEVASWYQPTAEGTFALAAPKIEAYVVSTAAGFGIRAKNAAQLAASTQQALGKRQAYSGAIEQQVALKTFTYCAATKGVDASYLPGLRTKLSETYGDNRGWSVGGLVEFKEVGSGCDFTVWLTAADLMPTFGAICDSMWSCRVGPNVVINFDRWQNASPSWNASGGSLSEYRHMVINHETGHWLSFDHTNCPGDGQPAPVMQQQSINLQGCTFNAWPTGGEVAALRRLLGI